MAQKNFEAVEALAKEGSEAEASGSVLFGILT